MNRIAEYRKRKGWSQQQLAVEAGLHVQTVSEAERLYRGKPSQQSLEAMATALGVDVSDLFKEPAEEAAG